MAAEERGGVRRLARRAAPRVARPGRGRHQREVRVWETTTQHGLAVDIQADTPVTGGRQDEPARCRIELKGNWHMDLMTAMRTQLADDYLIPEGLRHGVYVTAWSDTELWNDSADDRRRTARSRDRDTTTAELVSQAESLRDLGLDVRSAVVYVPRPAPRARRDRDAKAREGMPGRVLLRAARTPATGGNPELGRHNPNLPARRQPALQRHGAGKPELGNGISLLCPCR